MADFTPHMNVNNNKLAEYLHNQIHDVEWKSRGELFTKLTPDLLEF